MNIRMLAPPSSSVAGTLATNAATSTSSPTLSFASVPASVTAGLAVVDQTAGTQVGVVASTSSTTVTLTANAAAAVGNGDTLAFLPMQKGVANGRTYTAAPSSPIDVPDFDAAVLGANKWARVAPSGPTGARPTPNPNTNPPYLAALGAPFFDTSIAKLIIFDGSSWRDPATGNAV